MLPHSGAAPHSVVHELSAESQLVLQASLSWQFVLQVCAAPQCTLQLIESRHSRSHVDVEPEHTGLHSPVQFSADAQLPSMHRMPVPHSVPSNVASTTHMSVASSQWRATHTLVVHGSLVPMHTPLEQESSSVQNLPSSQGVASARGRFLQPCASSQ